MEINNIAVLIDFENIAAGIEKEGLGKVEIGLIMNRLRERGRVMVARSYADWGRFSRHKKELMFEGISLFELSAHGMNDKNRADVALVVDCMELAFTKDYVDTFCIVSGDSDFTPLIMKLRELNKRVVGCGTKRSTSRLIVEACDEFLFYDTLRKQTTQRPRRSKEDEGNELSREEAMELVTEALAALQRDNPGPVHASAIKEAILRKEAAFSETDLGFPTLARFMEFCAKQGIVRVMRDDRSGGYRVDAPDSEPANAAAPPPVQADGEARRYYDLLAAEDLEPLTRELRAELCKGVIETVGERVERKRRINLQWVCQDLARRFKGQVSQRQIKGVVNALHRGAVFLHPDGEPVRSFFAPFHLDRTPESLMTTLDQVYVGRLKELGVDIGSSTADIAALVYGDRRRTRDVEELMAWLSLAETRSRPRPLPLSEEDQGEDQAGDRVPTGPLPETDDDSEAAGGRRRRRRRGRGGNGGGEAAEAGAGAEVSAPELPAEVQPVAAPVSARASSRERAPAAPVEPEPLPVEPEPLPVDAELDANPSGRRRRRRGEAAPTRAAAPAQAAPAPSPAPVPAESPVADEATAKDDGGSPRRRRARRS